ncbi:MAG TPA: BMP family ABC transporter substrate-binding protein, partial [Flexilinea sp.]|nr:BMP family ABC transporter substrate-binding protein [Flexilinea sp.]
AGKWTRFDLFSGPIIDNQGNVVVPEGEKMEDADLDTFDCSTTGCKYGMHYWNEGIIADLP